MNTRTRASCSRPRSSGRERGVVLVLAIFAVALLTVLAFGIAAGVRTELFASRGSVARTQSLFLAQAGLSEAQAALMYDDPISDTLLDGWGPMAEDSLEWPHRLGEGYYRARVYDAGGRIDLNEADYTTFLQLTGDETIAAAIIDWRDENDNTLTPAGAEADYYQKLAAPYRPRNGPFETTGELLLVRGVSPALFFGSEGRPGLADLVTVESLSVNMNPDGNPPIDLNEFRNWSEPAFRDYMMQKLGSAITMYEANEIFRGLTELSAAGLPGYTLLSQLATAAGLDPGRIAQMIDYVTVTPERVVRGKVNLNTAPLEVLAALPGSSESLALAFIEQRREAPFTRLGEVVAFLFAQPGGMALFGQMIDRVTIRSSSFLAEAMGATEDGRGFRVLTALFRRTPDGIMVIRQAEQDWPLGPLPPEYLPAAKK